MFKSLFALVPMAMLAVGAFASESCRLDFRNPRQMLSIKPTDGWTVSESGRSVRAVRRSGSISLGDLPMQKGEFRLRWKVCDFGISPDAKDAHWGFSGLDADGSKAFFHTRGGDTGFIFSLTSPAGARLAGFAPKRDPRPSIDRDATHPRPSTVELSVLHGGFTLSLDGAVIASSTVPIGPLRNFEFYTYNVDVAFADFTVEAVEKTAFVPCAAPVSADELSGEAGAVMFWTQRGPDGALVDLLDAEGRPVLESSVGEYAVFRVAFAGGKALDFKRHAFFAQQPGDWAHLAFVWLPTGQARLFVNGLPYPTGNAAGERTAYLMFGNRLGEAKTVRFPTGKGGRKGPPIEDFRLYRRVVTNREVAEAYRARMRIDLVSAESVFPVGRPVSVPVRIGPGGAFTLPNPVEGFTNLTDVVDLTLRVRQGGRVLAERTVRGLAVETVQDVAVDAVTFPSAGDYLMEATVARRGVSTAPYRRTLVISAAEPVKANAVPASDESWKRGETLIERSFRSVDDMPFRDGEARTVPALGGYLEAGRAGQNRMACELVVPPDAVGRPLLLDVTWPDDKPRSMGLYLYPPLPGRYDRDRLQAGIQAGDEYPSSGKLQTASYLVYFPKTNYLFEARTMIADCPAAIASVRLSRLEEPWPRLAVRTPQGLPARRFGHTDEDQTFFNNLNVDTLKPRTTALLPVLLDYLAYTGQNAFHYSLMRYFFQFGPLEGNPGNGLFPWRQGELCAVFDAFKTRGVSFDANLQMGGLPEAKWWHLRESTLENALVMDSAGRRTGAYNCGDQMASFIHPLARTAFYEYLRGLVREASAKGVTTFHYLLQGNFGAWKSLKDGYDDGTVARFCRETGVRLPPDCADAAGKGRFAARFTALTGPHREAWLRWRANRVTEFVRDLVRFVRTEGRDAELVLGVGESEKADEDTRFAENGIDFAALVDIPDLGFSLKREPTLQRWRLFRGNERPRFNERLYDLNDPDYLAFRRRGKSVSAVRSCGTYYETFAGTLCPARYQSVFQDADVKPWGRYFLKDLAYSLAMGDALALYTGEQPLGSFGSEEVVREWAKAYCALPALPFEDVPGSGDPICVRQLETKNGVYLYLVNLHHTSVTATLGWNGDAAESTDLSNGSSEVRNAVRLRPFELRSFLLPCKLAHVTPTGLDRHAYDARLRAFDAAVRAFDAAGVDHALASRAVAEARQAIAAGSLGEAHRLLHSKEVSEALAKSGNLENLAAEAVLREAGVIRVNCGSTSYTTIDGELFSPDKADDGVTYGHLGSASEACVRETKDLPAGTPLAALYATEAYNLDGYRFYGLRPGRYRVRLYVKCGWPKGWKAGHWLNVIRLNGMTVRDPFDAFTAQGGDFNRPVTDLAFETEVGADGKIDLSFGLPAGYAGNGTVRFLNGIEIERIKKK